MDQCPHCEEFLEICPCCGVSFCSLCRMTEEELMAELEGEDDEGDKEGLSL